MDYMTLYLWAVLISIGFVLAAAIWETKFRHLRGEYHHSLARKQYLIIIIWSFIPIFQVFTIIGVLVWFGRELSASFGPEWLNRDMFP